MVPRLPEEIVRCNVEIPREGILFVGEKGAIMAGFTGEDPQLYAQGKREPLWPPQPSGKEGEHDRKEPPVWLQAFKGRTQSPGSFLNAGPISDAVTLGTVSLRAGKKVLFDSEAMKVTNDAESNQFLYRKYRRGWEL
jgi:hypothetical protein